MIRACKNDHRIGQYRLRDQILSIGRIGEQVKIVLIGGQARQQGLAIVNLQGHFDAWMAADEFRKHPRRKIFGGCAHGQSQVP